MIEDNARVGGRRLTFAVADLHGRHDLLIEALSAIETYEPAKKTIVFLGDYIDRGPQSAQVLARLIEGPCSTDTWICLKGNHEEMMQIATRDRTKIEWWMGNGGATTFASYEADEREFMQHLAWIDRLPSLHADENRVFVHAGVDPTVSLDAQPEETLLWKRYRGRDRGGHEGRHVVHGHDPDVEGPLHFDDRTALDTLAWRTGRLVIAVCEDRVSGAPVDYIEIKCPGATF